MKTKIMLLVLMLLAIITIISCSKKSNEIVLMDSAWIEQKLLSQIFIQVVEANTDYKVKYINGNGGVVTTYEAFDKGIIDVYPSHTGSQLSLIFDIDYTEDVRSRVTEICEAEAAKRGWSYINLKYENNYAPIVKREFAEIYNIRTVTDLKNAIDNYNLSLIGCADTSMYSRDNQMNWKNFISTYDIKLKSDTSMEWGVMYSALGSGDVDLIIGESANGFNIAYDAVVLEDDLHFWLPYEAVFVYKTDGLPKEVVDVVSKVSEYLNTDIIQQFIYRMNDGEDPQDIVKGWLASYNLI